MSTFVLGDGLRLPIEEAATQKLALIGRSGSGKSYAAGKFVEGLLGRDGDRAQVVVVDPVGVWYGLRLAADGKAAGIPIPIIGGEHGDISLQPGAGALIADLVVEKGTPLVLDVSGFTSGELRTFVTAFATELLHRKKQSRSPLMVVWEECQEVVPQKVYSDAARMVGAMERLIKIGRNFGIGTTLISQRPQAVNKDVLNQTELLLVFQTTGPQERKVVEGWIVEHGLAIDKVVDSLPALHRGTAYCWSPQWLRFFGKVQVGKKWTFDASATPTLGGKAQRTGPLAPVDLKAIAASMAATIEKAKADDPKELRKRIAELERELRTAKAERQVEQVTVPAISNKESGSLEVSVGIIRDEVRRLEEVATSIAQGLARVATSRQSAARVASVPRASHALAPRQREARPAGGGDYAVGTGGLRRILVALAQRPGGLTASQIGLRAGLSTRGGTWSTYISRARVAGWVAEGSDRFEITGAGIEALGSYEPLPTGDELLAHYLRKLGGGGAGRMLSVLADVYPAGLSKSDLASRAGISAAGGTFSTYLSRLRTLELIEGQDEIRASEELFS